MTYIPSLEIVQVGIEAVYADVAAPTIQLNGVEKCDIISRNVGTQVLDKRADTMPAYDSTIDKLWTECNMSGRVSYTQLAYFLDCMFGLDDSNPHAYIAELLPVTTLRTLNILKGQTDVCHSFGGAMLDKFILRGSTGGPLTFDAHFLGLPIVTDVVETIVDPAVVYAMGSHCALWIDPIATAAGTTPITTTIMGFEAEMVNTRQLSWHMGSASPDGYTNGKWIGSKLKLNLELTAAMLVHLDEILDERTSPHGYNIEIVITDLLTTSHLTLTFAGEALVPPKLYTSTDGIVTMELELVAKYSSQAAFLSCWKAALVYP